MTQASIDEANERSEARHCSDGVEVYVRGSGWPTAATVSTPNPWSREDWNLTGQAKVLKRDRVEADRLAQAAGHKNALGARVENAK